MRLRVIYEPQGRAREFAELAVNLYTGCLHGCQYCYCATRSYVNEEKFRTIAEPRPNIIENLRKDCQDLAGQDIPRILLCFTCDPYQPLEEGKSVTTEALKTLSEYNLAVQVLTKGGTRAVKDFDILARDHRNAFATTLTLLDYAQSKQWEPRAALPGDRIIAIQRAHDREIETWVSLEPVIDPKQSLEIIRLTHPFVDHYKVGVLNYHPRGREIDWRKFARQAVDLLKSLNKPYIIKEDLQRYLDV